MLENCNKRSYVGINTTTKIKNKLYFIFFLAFEVIMLTKFVDITKNCKLVKNSYN